MTFLKQIDGRWQGRGNASPRDFFQSAEPGFYLDFSATAPLYQDNVGATPLTLPDQQVGMALDVSRGMALGPELVTNGDFSAGATGWTLGVGWSVSGGAAVSAGGGNAALSQSGGTYVAGRTYQVTFNITVSSGYLLAYVANGNNAQISTSGAVSLRLVASASGGLAFFGFSFVGSIDNVSVREIKSVPAVQASLGLRPKWGRMPKTGKRNRLGYTEQFDNAAWSKTASTTVTANAVVAPDGTTTADTVTSGSAAGYIYPSTAIFASAGGAAYTYSIYAKAGTATSVQLLLAATATYTGTFNLSTGVASTITPNTTVTMVDVGGGWYRCVLTCASVANTVYTEAQIGRVALGLTFSLWGAQLELGSTATAYQRVTNAFDVTEAGLPSYGFIRPDLMDDYLTVTTPAAQTGDVMVFGRKGTWLETGVGYGSGAAVAIGPTTMTGLPAWLLQAVQGSVSDISGGLVGVLAIGRTLTAAERTAALNYYKARGAAGLLVAGAELWSDTGVIVGTGWTAVGGVYTHSAGGDTFRKDLGLVSGKTYQVTFTVSGRTSGTIAPVLGGTAEGPTVAADGTYTQLIASGVNVLLYFQPSTDFVGSVSNISVKPLTVTP